MGTCGLPDIYTLSPQVCGPSASGVHIRLITHAHVSYYYTIHVYILTAAWADLENFLGGGGGEPNIMGIKVAQLNVLLELQLRTLLVIFQIPV